MNQVKPKSEFHGPSPSPKLANEPRPELTKADAQILHGALVKGDQAIARQTDIIELHKRIVAMLTTLNTGLGEQQVKKAAEDRTALVKKLEKIELGVNGMEAVLRIEMAPQLERMLDEAFARHMPKQKPLRARMLVIIAAVCTGLVIGAAYSEQLKEAYILAVAKISPIFGTK